MREREIVSQSTSDDREIDIFPRGEHILCAGVDWGRLDTAAASVRTYDPCRRMQAPDRRVLIGNAFATRAAFKALGSH